MMDHVTQFLLRLQCRPESLFSMTPVTVVGTDSLYRGQIPSHPGGIFIPKISKVGTSTLEGTEPVPGVTSKRKRRTQNVWVCDLRGRVGREDRCRLIKVRLN